MEPKETRQRVRIQPRIDKTVARLAKAKAIHNGQTFEHVVEALLKAWVSGKIKVVESGS